MAYGDVAEEVATADGRALTYLEVGDPNGPLVIHNHGGPSSRLEAHLLADFASKNRLRLVCVDREPGRREVWYSLTPVGQELCAALVNVIDVAQRLKRTEAMDQ